MAEDIKELVTYLVKTIARKPEEVVVEEEKEGEVIMENIKVAKEDIALVIGKSGRNISAVRELVKVVAGKQNLHVEVKIVD